MIVQTNICVCWKSNQKQLTNYSHRWIAIQQDPTKYQSIYEQVGCADFSTTSLTHLVNFVTSHNHSNYVNTCMATNRPMNNNRSI